MGFTVKNRTYYNNLGQIVHPFGLKDEEERNNPDSFYGDMTYIWKNNEKFRIMPGGMNS